MDGPWGSLIIHSGPPSRVPSGKPKSGRELLPKVARKVQPVAKPRQGPLTRSQSERIITFGNYPSLRPKRASTIFNPYGNRGKGAWQQLRSNPGIFPGTTTSGEGDYKSLLVEHGPRLVKGAANAVARAGSRYVERNAAKLFDKTGRYITSGAARMHNAVWKDPTRATGHRAKSLPVQKSAPVLVDALGPSLNTGVGGDFGPVGGQSAWSSSGGSRMPMRSTAVHLTRLGPTHWWDDETKREAKKKQLIGQAVVGSALLGGTAGYLGAEAMGVGSRVAPAVAESSYGSGASLGRVYGRGKLIPSGSGRVPFRGARYGSVRDPYDPHLGAPWRTPIRSAMRAPRYGGRVRDAPRRWIDYERSISDGGRKRAPTTLDYRRPLYSNGGRGSFRSSYGRAKQPRTNKDGSSNLTDLKKLINF